MELDKLFFKKLFNFYKRKTQKKIDPLVQARTIELEYLKPRLTILARALTGRPIDIITSEREGGWTGTKFFLPEKMSFFAQAEDNLKFYIFRTLYLAAQKRLQLNWPNQKTIALSWDSGHPVAESQQEAFKHSTPVLDYLAEEFPVTKELHEELKKELLAQATEKEPADLSWLYGRWMFLGEDLDATGQLHKYSDLVKKSAPTPTTNIKAKNSDEVTTLQVDKEAQEQFVLTHNFEKVETVEEFQGTWRDFDGDDSLSDDQDALQQTNLKHTVRVDDIAHSVYQAEFAGTTSVMESVDKDDHRLCFLYDEWDRKKRKYLVDYCKVYPTFSQDKNAAYVRRTFEDNRLTMNSLRKIFAQMSNELQTVRRLDKGAEFDLDALIDFQTDIAAGHTPSDKIYLSKRKLKKDFSFLFLLDISLSSDGYAKGNRVLDVEKQVVLLFGEALHEHDVEFEIDGFYSKTRNNCSYIHFKTFDESWKTAQAKLAAAEPQGYTRIGPALRHAGALLQKRSARKKWVILLSDGKPNDYDKYGGQYGVADIRRSLYELHQNHIQTYAFAIEEQAKYYLPQMFGNDHYDIVANPNEMLQSMAKLYRRIL